jgi:tight adherence protein B
MSLGLLVTLVFVVATAGVIGVYMLFAGRSQAALRKSVDSRLLELSGGGLLGADGDDSLIRTQASGPLPMVDRAAREAMRGLAIELWLAQSGTRLTISALLVIAVVSGLTGAFAGFMFGKRAPFALLGFVLGAAVPFMVVRQKRSSRLYTFEERFPEALDLISRAIRAGHAFSAGLKMVADEMPEPVGPEFRKAFEEQNFGMSLKDALNNLTVRVPILDVRFFATAVLIQKETGGNLSEILDSLAAVVRERFKIRRQVRVHTAHGRFTGYVLLALPAFLAVALSFINPDHMNMLFKDPIGKMLIGGAIVMQVIGWLWIKRVVKIEV